MALFCPCLARIHKHITTCPAWDMDECIQEPRLWMGISRRHPNSLTELGRPVFLQHFMFSFHSRYVFCWGFFAKEQVFVLEASWSLTNFLKSSQQGFSENWKDFLKFHIWPHNFVWPDYQFPHHQDSEMKSGMLLQGCWNSRFGGERMWGRWTL